MAWRDAPSGVDDPAITVIVDEAALVRSIDEVIEHLLGVRRTGALGGPLAALFDPADHRRLAKHLDAAATQPGPARPVALRVLDAAGRPVWSAVTVQRTATAQERVVRVRPYRARLPETEPGSDAESNRFHALVQNSADIVLVVDPDGTLRSMNPAMLRTLGRAPAEMIGTQILEIIHPDDQEAVTQSMVAVLEHPERSRHVEMRARHADGTYRWIDGRMQNLLDHPEVGGILGNGRDITERRLAEEALRAGEARFRSLAAASPCGIFELDDDGVVHYGNERWSEITGCVVEVDTSLWSIVHPDDAHELAARWSASGTADGLDARIQVVRPDGTCRWVELRCRPIAGSARHVGTLDDVTALQEYQDELTHLALHDQATGLPNRTMLLDRLAQAVARARATATTCAVLFVDLDRFKVVNDSLGHAAGDQVLQTVARRLAHLARPGDLITRFGGDEFVVVAEHIGTPDDPGALAAAMDLAERIQLGVGGRVDLDDSAVHLSVSVGVVVGSTDSTAGELIRDAEAAMYAAKARGRDRVQAFDAALHRAAVQRLAIEQELRAALERDEFELHFQPIVATEDGRLIGAEALLRWRHPERGLLAPGAFLAVAEESGVLATLGDWILAAACAEAVTWPTRGDGDPLAVFVNLASAQLADRGVVDDVARALAASGIDPRRLHVEVTEGMLQSGAHLAAQVLHELRDLGVRVAIDDFGTGYSSLSYLTTLPVDLLKIDRSFVEGLGSRATDQEVTAAIVALARTLGLQTVAEGVETADQLDALRALGCDAAQGYWFARALPAPEFARLAVRTDRPAARGPRGLNQA